VRNAIVGPLVASAVVLSACATTVPPADTPRAAAEANPFFHPSPLPYGAPQFDRIRNEHYAPAIERGMALHAQEIEEIAGNPERPTFENTIVAMERAGQDLGRVLRVFYNIVGVHTNPELQATQREMAPRLAAHSDAISLNPALFARIQQLYESRDRLELDREQRRLLERYHTDFVRSGAQLDADRQARMREINGRLAALGTQFNQAVLAEVNASAVIVDTREELDGLTDAQIQAAAAAAAERGHEGKYAITLLNTSGQPPLASLSNRSVRERVHRASLQRGQRGNEHDTRALMVETLQLRAERSRMLGYDNFAEFTLAEQTAGTPAAVNEMLARVGPPAVSNARAEGAELQRYIDANEPEPFPLASWDWAFYAEKVRRERFDFDESEVRPYFELQNVLENGVFYAATRLYGITFTRRDDLPVYHPDVQVWEVFEADGTPIGLMYGDFYARSTKRGGAWMNSYVAQSRLLGHPPVTGNHLNIPKPPEGEPTLMTWDEVTTLFHEMGHVLHGLFSNVRYPRFSGTSVPRDFVEYPSQVNEMWAEWPSVLENYARHHRTGERIPQALLDRVLEAGQFNEGFRSTEYIAASITDMAIHQLPPEQIPSAETLMDYEAQALRETGMDYAPVPPRYRFPYFSHIMGGYGAGYYSYIWSEVLDADNVAWFAENGGLTLENGQRYRERILARGGSWDAMEMYRDFAGRDPDPTHLLRRRGLLTDDSVGPPR
jgi:peptidyl-dipeptidase Dcp